MRQQPGAGTTKTYRCPGCDQEIAPGTPHVVAWPADGINVGVDERRDWHRSCWRHRLRRGSPGQKEGGSRVSDIRPSTVLLAKRTPVTLPTADGLRLVGELALPADTDPVATLICLHPLPTHGGMMDSHLFKKAAFRLPALAQLAVLRFNTRGTSSEQGTSRASSAAENPNGTTWRPALGGGRCGPARPVAARLVVRHRTGPEVGPGPRSGRRGCDPLSPPLRRAGDADLDRWAASGRPLVALIPEFDDYLRPDEARRRFARVPAAEVVAVPGAKHLWVGEPSSASR